MMQDLFEHIVALPTDSERISTNVLEIGRRLMSGSRVGTDSEGLDVIVLAQPHSTSALGQIRNLLEPGMRGLRAQRGLERPRTGLDLLNFLLLLDFEDFWAEDP